MRKGEEEKRGRGKGNDLFIKNNFSFVFQHLDDFFRRNKECSGKGVVVPKRRRIGNINNKVNNES